MIHRSCLFQSISLFHTRKQLRYLSGLFLFFLLKNEKNEAISWFILVVQVSLRRDGTLMRGNRYFSKGWRCWPQRDGELSSSRIKMLVLLWLLAMRTFVGALFDYLHAITFEILRVIVQFSPLCVASLQRDEERIDSRCADASSEFAAISHLWQISECVTT